MKRFVFIFSIFLSILFSSQVYAAPKNTITIAPSFKDISITANQFSATYPISVTNTTGTDATFQLSALDLKNLDATGGQFFEGATGDQFKKYGPADWVTLDASSLTIPAGKSKNIVVTIKNSKDLSPGGHYAAILLQATKVASTADKGHVNIKQTITSLLFLKKLGGEKYDLKLSNISYNSSWYKFPSNFKVTFNNPGNVHNVPRGTIEIKNPLGQSVTKGVVNLESGILLPQKDRTYIVNVSSSSGWLWPGRYTAKITYRYDGLDATTSKTISFFYISPIFILLCLITVVGAAFIIWRFRLDKKFIKLLRKFKQKFSKKP